VRGIEVRDVIELMLAAERSLSVGQLDAAERMYRQAMEADPKNSIAVVGLARVALDRGDDRTAYQFARSALEIDPDNAAAQRLASRLAEVMQFRGEAVPTDPPPQVQTIAVATKEPEPAEEVPGVTAAPEPELDATPAAAAQVQTAATATPKPTTLPSKPAAVAPKPKRGLVDRMLGRH
jgi:tetratricopeptide (TPR) repeat protein